MRVSGILTLMGHLSVGNDNITLSERAIFLQYLNLAHLELYQETANFNQDLLVKEALAGAQGAVTLSQTPYLVNAVYNVVNKHPLTRFSPMDPASYGLAGANQPFGYVVQKNVVSFVPAQTAPVSVIVWYIPQPPTLTEETEENNIPYPMAYHPVLADGALYYLFQEEGGFKSASKSQEAKERWEIGKSKLLSYLYSSSGQTLSTFSNA